MQSLTPKIIVGHNMKYDIEKAECKFPIVLESPNP
jgi:hypothetical protein